MTPLKAYLTSLREIRSSGEAVDEISHSSPLANFYDETAKTLKPKLLYLLLPKVNFHHAS